LSNISPKRFQLHRRIRSTSTTTVGVATATAVPNAPKLLLAVQGVDSHISKFIWKNKAPPRVQFFAWLLTQSRIQCRANLPKKSIVQEATCEACGATEETATHIIFQCPFAQDFWRALHFALPADIRATTLYELPCPDHVPNMQFAELVLLCCWQLWKWRNGIVFRGESSPLGQVMLNCKTDAALWRCRMKPLEASVC
jgi:hypothetical protein